MFVRYQKTNGDIVNPADGMDQSGVRYTRSRFLDLGEVINGNSGGAGYQLAVNAFCYSAYFNDLEWVRNGILCVNSDQSYEVYTSRRDTYGIASSNAITLNNQSSTGGSNRSHAINATSALFGYEAKFAVKNVGSAAGNFFLRVQLMGT